MATPPGMSTAGLLLLSIFCAFSAFGSGKELYIISAATDPCPKEPCLSLNAAVGRPSRYFTSNTKVVLDQGYHNVTASKFALIENVSNLQIVGSNRNVTVINCQGHFGFMFFNVSALTISDIQLLHCGAKISAVELRQTYANILHLHTGSTLNSTALYLVQITHVHISRISVINSSEAGMVGINVLGNCSLVKSQFHNNYPQLYLIFVDDPGINPSLSTWHHVLHLEFKVDQNETSKLQRILSQTTLAVDRLNEVGVLSKQHSYGIQIDVIDTSFYGMRVVAMSRSKSQMLLVFKNLNVSDCTQISRILNASVVFDNVTFSRNWPQGALQVINSSIIFNGKTQFAFNAGAIVLDFVNSSIVFEGKTVFLHNSGFDVLTIADSASVRFKAALYFIQNEARTLSPVSVSDSLLYFQNDATFLLNSGKRGGAISLSQSIMFAYPNTSIQFIENHSKSYGGAIDMIDSDICTGHGARFSYRGNTAEESGGAIAIHNEAMIWLNLETEMEFANNRAQQYGGAIYVNVYDIQRPDCFYQPQVESEDELYSIHFTFDNNSAEYAGDVLYGGEIFSCRHKYVWRIIFEKPFTPLTSRCFVFDTIFKVNNTPPTDLSTVSSDPIRACICVDNLAPNCDIVEYTVSAYPGKEFQICVVAVGQMYGTVPHTVQSRLVNANKTTHFRPSKMGDSQHSQIVSRTCTNLNYTVFSEDSNQTMLLSTEYIPDHVAFASLEDYKERQLESQGGFENYYPNDACVIQYQTLQEIPLFLHIRMQPCPTGFIFVNQTMSCECEPILINHGLLCNNNTFSVRRLQPFWIGSSHASGIVVHEHCPFDYCKPGSIDLDLRHLDEQCAFHRSGILCGACQQNLSQVLGTSNCKQCSNIWILVLVVVFLLSGAALVLFVMVLNLTVSTGTVNGIIFYSNIVQANQAIFFPLSEASAYPFSVFIAWFNLDLGIETCFYNGLDAYSKTWLQFLFPFYIWLLVTLIIVSSHYSTVAAKISGRNAVPVLATLFLLSYTKLLRISIKAFSSTVLRYKDGTVTRVWLHDGNVPYLVGKHIPLFIAVLISLTLLSAPYTVMLLFIQCLQRRSKYRAMLLVRKLKPLFDAYTGPYKDKCRFWTGLLLLSRVILFLVFSVNTLGDPAINLLAINISTFGLFICAALLKGVYKLWQLNLLEYVFFFNLGALSSATLYTKLSGSNQMALTSVSVGCSVLIFAGIILYHIYKTLLSSKWLKIKFQKKTNQRRASRQDHPAQQALDTASERPDNTTKQGVRPLVLNFNDLREPLLEYCETGNL